MLLLLFALQCPDGSPPPCRAAPRAAPRAVIAVFPFESRSSDSNDAYLAEALPEQIAGRLSRVRQLQVRSATNVAAQWRRTPDPAAVARALRVEWYVTGSIRRVGRQLSVNAELVRAASGNGVWSAPFRRTDDNLAAIEEQIAESVAVGVVGQLAPEQRRALRTTPTRNVEAYRLYLLGRTLTNRRTAADINRAVAVFTEAARLDSRFAEAWARLGYARVLQIPWGNDEGLSDDSVLVLARDAIGRAHRLDSAVADAWLATGAVNGLGLRGSDLQVAWESYRRSLAIDSLNADTWHGLAYLFGPFGLELPELVESFARRALDLNPDLRNTWRLMAEAELAQGRPARAEAFIDSALSRGSWALGIYVRSAIRYVRGDLRGAIADMDSAIVLGADNRRSRAAPIERDIMLSALGDTARARRLADSLRAADGGRALPLVALANLAMATGRRDEAIGLIRQLLSRPDTLRLRCGSEACSRHLTVWRALHGYFFVREHNHPEIRRLLDETRPRVSWLPQ